MDYKNVIRMVLQGYLKGLHTIDYAEQELCDIVNRKGKSSFAKGFYIGSFIAAFTYYLLTIYNA